MNRLFGFVIVVSLSIVSVVAAQPDPNAARTKLLSALADAKSQEEAARLLQAQLNMVDTPLVAAMGPHIEDLLRQRKWTEAARLVDVQMDAARLTKAPRCRGAGALRKSGRAGDDGETRRGSASLR